MVQNPIQNPWYSVPIGVKYGICSQPNGDVLSTELFQVERFSEEANLSTSPKPMTYGTEGCPFEPGGVYFDTKDLRQFNWEGCGCRLVSAFILTSGWVTNQVLPTSKRPATQVRDLTLIGDQVKLAHGRVALPALGDWP